MKKVISARIFDILLSYAIIIYLGRFESPEILGIYVVVASYTALMSQLLQLGSANAILSDFKGRESFIYLNSYLLKKRSKIYFIYSATCISFAIFSLTIWSALPNELYLLTVLGFIAAFGTASLTAFTSILRASNQVELATTIDSLGKNALPSIFIIATLANLFEFNLLALFCLQLANLLIAIIYSFSKIKSSKSIMSIKRQFESDRKFYDAVVKLGVVGFLFAGLRQVDTILVAHYLGTAFAGMYRVSMLPSLIGFLLYGSFVSIAMPRFNNFISYTEYMNRYYGKIVKTSMVVLLIIILLYILLAKKIYLHFFRIENDEVFISGAIALVAPFTTFFFKFAYEYFLMMRKTKEMVIILGGAFLIQSILFTFIGENLSIVQASIIVWANYIITNFFLYRKLIHQ